ncbi:GDSL-type esterase/lipase family protein [Planotetraspora sp. A-T 1434]|uniref:SGNH/GDSL hydrolase family protein n=1 Tax=Planotetraspora sp. A-T 1434 TaxID=2979219 RepID=UPI0021C12170|nr:SGNH/GDSL hydrolase family protein [Planotetraspora sp. A-T 1434]MCT9930341.1 GDSL-type esterase/lipase family protein [Planotetraspora sp. A-T 1434]
MIKKITSVLAVAVLFGPGTAHAQTRPQTRPQTRAQTSPRVLAALGDSISAGFNACGWYVSCTSRSWAAGDNTEVNSHYLRLLALGPAIKGHNLNFAVPGSTSADLVGQARQAVEKGADYVTILIGAQDACMGSAKAMTPVATYRQRIDEALAVLKPTGASVFVASIPDLKRLWRAGRDNAWARTFWTIGNICPSMLANPKSMAKKDEARRDEVRERVMDYNDQLKQACARYGPACRYDGGAVFSYPFTLKLVSAWDYFHPNADGQKALAKVTFDAGFFPATEP